MPSLKHDLVFVENAWEDYTYWAENDSKILKRINELIKDIDRNIFKGIGKPEPLMYKLAGFWSRRITQEHRLVYKIEQNSIIILMCSYHYR